MQSYWGAQIQSSTAASSSASVAFGGIVSPGLYQFNLTVPEVPDGDVPATAQIGAIQSSSKLMVSIKH